MNGPAPASQREQVEIGHFGLHWAALDEDISVAGLLAGRGDRTRDIRPRPPITPSLRSKARAPRPTPGNKRARDK